MAVISYTVDPNGGPQAVQGTVGDDQIDVTGATTAALLSVFGDLGADTLTIGQINGDSAIYLDQAAGPNASIVAYGIERLILGSASGDQLTPVYGGVGHDDIAAYGPGTYEVFGGDGNDRLTSSGTPSYHPTILHGGGGDDVFIAASPSSSLFVGQYNIYIMDGGSGFDTIDFTSNSLDYVSVDLEEGYAESEVTYRATSFEHVELTSFEGVIGTWFSDGIAGNGFANSLSGAGGNDHLSGRGGDDSLLGGIGNDHLYGGAGNDLLDGGTGYDTADYGDSGSSVAVTLETENQQQTIGAGIDRLVSVEALAGSAFADTLIGNGGDNVINGRDGNDLLYGQGGADQIAAGSGADYVLGGDRNDGLYGEADNDIMAAGTGDDLLDGGGGDDVLYGEEGRDQIAGGEGRDVGYGQADDDNLYGQDGDDVLLGGAGADTLQGGDDNDNLYGEDGADIILGGSGADYVSGGAGIDQIFGEDGNDQIGGGEDTDYLFGGAGQDQLYGEGGNDILHGGADADYLFGGAGQDLFVFTAASDSSLAAYDYVLDFEIGFDVLDFRQATGGGPATAAILQSGGSSLVYLDLGQDGTDDMVVYVNGVTNLTMYDLAL